MRIEVSESIYLSAVQPSDRSAIVQLLEDRRIQDHTLSIPYPYTEADADAWFGALEASTAWHGRPVVWAIRDAAGRFLGACGFKDFNLGQSHCAEIGYWLGTPYWGRGIMTAVIRRLCAYAFAELGLERIIAYVFATNAASARVLEKCGFEQEGYLRKHFRKDNRYLDAKLYAILRESS